MTAAEGRADPHPGPPVFKGKDRGPPYFLTHPHAAAAEYADIIIPVEKGIIMLGLIAAVIDRIVYLCQPDLFHHGLEFALPVIRAVTASRAYACFPDGVLVRSEEH